jgi:hypothetical protein
MTLKIKSAPYYLDSQPKTNTLTATRQFNRRKLFLVVSLESGLKLQNEVRI